MTDSAWCRVVRVSGFLLMLSCGLALAQKGPEQARNEFAKGQLAAQKSQVQEARRSYERAVELDPFYADAWFELGRMQYQAGQTAEARHSYEMAIQADPKSYGAYLSLAVLERQAREWSRVIEITGQLLKLNPVDFPRAYLDRALAQYNIRDFAAAEESLKAGQRLDAEHKEPKFLQLLGLVSIEKGDLANGARYFREFLERAPSDPDADAVRKLLAKAENELAAKGQMESAGIVFRADTELALIRFQVAVKKGGFVTDLRPDEIQILEDGVPQRISLFEGGRSYPRATPLEITLLFDASGSVKSSGNLDPYIFNANLLDEFENASIAIYAFGGENLIRTTGLTRDPRNLKTAMDAVVKTEPGATPLFNAIAETARQAAARPGGVRILLVISDGVSNTNNQRDVRRAGKARDVARENGVAVYPVLLPYGVRGMVGGQDALDAGFSIRSFLDLGPSTGGTAINVASTEDLLAKILKNMAARLRYDYLTGYYPSKNTEKKTHKVEVVLKSKDRGEIVGGKRIIIH